MLSVTQGGVVMRKARWIAISALGLAQFAAADEPAGIQADDEHVPLPAEVIAGEDFFDDLQNAWRWQAPSSDPVFVYNGEPLPRLDDFEFRDGSSIGRMARLRSLSLLTLAEFGDSRLFFGVNDQEVVGIHFGAVSGTDSDRHLEMARMPWLSRNTSDD